MKTIARLSFLSLVCSLWTPVWAQSLPVEVKLDGVTWISAFQTDDLRLENGVMKASTFGFDPYLESRNYSFDAADAPTMVITMAITGGNDAELFWTTGRGSWGQDRATALTLIPDGKMHTYIVPMSGIATWTGRIAGLRFDPCKTPLARFEIASIAPSKAPKAGAEIWYEGPDEIIVAEGTEFPLSAGVANTGGTNLAGVKLSVSMEGEVSVVVPGVVTGVAFPVAPPPVKLAAGEAIAPAQQMFVAGREGKGKGKIVLSVEGAEAPKLEIPVTVVKARTGAKPDSRASNVVTLFDGPENNSEWVVTGADVKAAPSYGLYPTVSLAVDGKASIVTGGQTSAPKAFQVGGFATGDVTASIVYRDGKGVRRAAMLKLPEKMDLVEIPVPALAGNITVERVDLTGKGACRLAMVLTSGGKADPPQVVLQGKGLYRSDSPTVEGYIVEIGVPLKVEMKYKQGEVIDVKLVPVELGEVEPIANAPERQTYTAKGRGRAILLLPDRKAIGVYDLTVTSPVLTEPYKTRLYAVESAATLEQMQYPMDRSVYGRARGKGREEIPVFDYGANAAPPADAKMSLYETDLSPAWLLDIATKNVKLFSGLGGVGLGQPTLVAVPTAEGVKVLPAKGKIAAQMSEPWLLVSFAGSRGWKLWDVPILLVLQHKPTTMEFTNDGLALTFAGKCGYLEYMPLYGFYRPPQKGQLILTKFGLPERGIETWTWADGLPKDVQDRARWWARSLRKFPIDCDEKFNVSPASGDITVSQKFTYITIADDWKTEPLTVAPLSPTLGFTQFAKGFPIEFSKPVTDPDMMTPYGPYMVVEGADSYSYTVADVVDYVNETEIQSPADTSIPAVDEALRHAQAVEAARFAGGPNFMVEFDRKLFVWSQLAEHVFPKGLAYADPVTQARLKGAYVNYYNTFFFGTGAAAADGDRGWWRPELKGMAPNARKWFLDNTVCIDGPGIHGGLFGDSGKISASAAYNVWSYCHYTGDWELARRRWGFLKRTNTNAVNMDWKAMGRQSNAEAGEHLPPVLAFARLAYLAGDMDAYYFGCYSYMRDALLVYAKQRAVGAEYFRQRQPYVDDQKPMPKWALANHVLGETAAWVIDGRGYTPISHYRNTEVQTDNRWVRFSSEDAARIYREHFADQAAEELEAMRIGEFQNHSQPVAEQVSFAASILRLYSYLLDTPAGKLAELFPPSTWEWEDSNNGTLMMSLAVIRGSFERQYNRLIPRETPDSGFVTGLARQPVKVGWRGLLCFRTPESDWPRARWFMRGGRAVGVRDQHFYFGRIVPGAGKPRAIETTQINWATHVVVFK